MTNEEIVEEIYHEAYALGFIDELREKIDNLKRTIEHHKLSHGELVYKAYYLLKKEEVITLDTNSLFFIKLVTSTIEISAFPKI